MRSQRARLFELCDAYRQRRNMAVRGAAVTAAMRGRVALRHARRPHENERNRMSIPPVPRCADRCHECARRANPCQRPPFICTPVYATAQDPLMPRPARPRCLRCAPPVPGSSTAYEPPRPPIARFRPSTACVTAPAGVRYGWFTLSTQHTRFKMRAKARSLMMRSRETRAAHTRVSEATRCLSVAPDADNGRSHMPA